MASIRHLCEHVRIIPRPPASSNCAPRPAPNARRPNPSARIITIGPAAPATIGQLFSNEASTSLGFLRFALSWMSMFGS